MSNLGPYQEFTTAAAKAGGVLKHLAKIERNAVDAAKPVLYAKGGAAGAALATAVILSGKRYLDKRRADQAAADEAKRELVMEFDGDEGLPEAGLETS